MEKRLKFGSILLRTNLNRNPKDIYLTYKKRMLIEQSFDVLKNLLEQDHSYMRSDTSFNAWSFINHISLMLCYRLYDEMLSADILKKYSAKDCIYYLNDIRILNINGCYRRAILSSRRHCIMSHRQG